MTQTSKKPAYTIRYGSIRVAIWKNQNQNGVNYSVTAERRYMADNQWHGTNSFFKDDLLTLGKALSDAFTWIFAQGKKSESSTPTEEAAA